MEIIGSKSLWSFVPGKSEAQECKCTAIRKVSPVDVQSYLELATKSAELQYRNRDYVLLFRGQPKDYKNYQHNTTLKPSLFRDSSGHNPSADTLRRRFKDLDSAERILVNS